MSCFPKNPKTTLQLTAEALAEIKMAEFTKGFDRGVYSGRIEGFNMIDEAFVLWHQAQKAEIAQLKLINQDLTARILSAVSALNTPDE